MADSKKGKQTRPVRTPAPPPPSATETPGESLERSLDLIAGLVTRFGRYGWDLLGVICFALALLTLLALTGLSQGSLLDPWAQFLMTWFGWGSLLLVFGFALGGLLALRKQGAGLVRVQLGQVIALECATLAALALLSILGGNSLDTANVYGGRIGWALAETPIYLGLSPMLRTVGVLVFFLGFLFAGLGLPHRIGAWIERQAQAEQPADPALPLVGMSIAAEPPEEARPTVQAEAAARKKAQSLPAEFRKSFKVQAPEAEKPAAPLPRDERLPPLSMLTGEQSFRPDEKNINLTAGLIEKTMAEFGIPAKVVGFRIGPTVTQFAVEPGFVEKPGPDGTMQRQKVRVSQISALSRDLALALSAERLRIEAPVPGRSYVGIEVPNARSSVVRLRPILESEAIQKIGSNLAIALGRDVSGQPVVADLARMPHLLIAGTTGSGKSVCIAALTACLVANNTPDNLRLAMIDPKMVELVRFNGLPHLLGKVETDLERILGVLRWSLGEMDHRYRLLEQAHARDIASYNKKMEKRHQPGMPRIVLMVDELADLMMSAPDQTEHSLVRLAQMARAVGIHLVVATQRPSTDVVTGLIKANFPARISFTVASSIDSRVILDTPGAETLLGRGDMLFLNPEVGNPQRAQGVYVTDPEIEALQQFWQKSIPGRPESTAPWEAMMNESEDGNDALVEQAITVVRGSKRTSTSLLQRRLRIGYPRAARLMDQLEELGVVGPSQGGGRDREVLIDPEEGEEIEQDHGDV